MIRIEKPKVTEKRIPGLRPYHIVEFVVSGGQAVANAIRRTILEELETVVLHADIKDFETPHHRETLCIFDRLLSRIGQIKIRQNISREFTTELIVRNRSPSIMKVRVGHLKNADKLGANITPLLEDVRPNKSVTLRNIRVVSGFGYDHKKFSMVHSMVFHPRDYIWVTKISPKNMFHTKACLRKDVEKALVAQGYKKFHLDPIGKSGQIVVTKNLSAKNKALIAKVKAFEYMVDKDIPHVDVKVIKPTHYIVGYTTDGNIAPLDPLRRALEAIRRNAEDYVLSDIIEKDADGKEKKILLVTTPHSFTIGELFKSLVYEESGGHAVLRGSVIHNTSRKYQLFISHPDAAKIFKKAQSRIKTMFADGAIQT